MKRKYKHSQARACYAEQNDNNQFLNTSSVAHVYDRSERSGDKNL